MNSTTMKIIKRILIALCILGLSYWGYSKLQANKGQIVAEAAASQIKPEAIPVQVTTLKLLELDNTISVNGVFAPNKELMFMATNQGQVESVLFDVGTVVAEGQVLATLDDDMLQAQLVAAQANLDKGTKDVERFKRLVEQDALTRTQLEQAQLGVVSAQTSVNTLQIQLSKLPIKSPINGRINKRMVEPGNFVAPGTPLCQIVDVNTIKLIAKVVEGDVVKIRKGMKVTVKADVYTDQQWTGTVSHIGMLADAAMAYDVEITLANPKNSAIMAGMNGKAVFAFANGRKASMIDRKAIVGSLQDAKVYVLKGDQVYSQKVTTGITQGDQVEILSGLSADQQVVTSGQVNLDEGTKVTLLK
jgi:membrane fusion protein (multidrug efflux system)